MPDKTPKAPARHSKTPHAIDDVTEAGLAFSRAVLAAEVEIVATVLGLGAALVPFPHAGTAVPVAAQPSEVEDGFDNMPV